MKYKALFVAPYAAMENLIEECRAEESELDLHIKIGNLHEGVAMAVRAEAEGFDVIISRGGTAKLIGEAVDIPVIDVHVSGYDMLRVLTLANDFPRKKAIVGFPAITLGAKAIIDLLEIPIDIFTINDENETEALLRRLKQEGYQLIMGDVVTFETASRLGLLGILIQSGREAIHDAFKEAKTVSRWMMTSKLEIDRLKTILQVTAHDFMVLSDHGDVVYEQWRNFSTRPITDLSLEKGAFQDLGSRRGMALVTDHNGRTLKLIKTKIVLHESTYFVYEFSEFKANQAVQEMIRVSTGPSPMVIHQSDAMNTCLTMINRCISCNHFILMGQRGTGKELISGYIHDHKFHGDGLYASIQAADLLGLNPDDVDIEIKTIYIHTFDPLDDGLEGELWQKVETLKEKGITIICSMVEEAPLWANMMYGDDVIHVHIPSLDERKGDLKELATSFLLHFNQTLGTSAIKINEKGLALLADYSWPGNVSELKALLQEAVLMEKGYVIESPLIETLLHRKGVDTIYISSDLLNGSLEQIEKKIIEKVLEQEEYNQTKAAKRLNINRSTLWRKLKD